MATIKRYPEPIKLKEYRVFISGSDNPPDVELKLKVVEIINIVNRRLRKENYNLQALYFYTPKDLSHESLAKQKEIDKFLENSHLFFGIAHHHFNDYTEHEWRIALFKLTKNENFITESDREITTISEYCLSFDLKDIYLYNYMRLLEILKEENRGRDKAFQNIINETENIEIDGETGRKIVQRYIDTDSTSELSLKSLLHEEFSFGLYNWLKDQSRIEMTEPERGQN